MNYIQSDPQWNDGNYDKPTEGWFRAYGLLRTMIDGVPHLQKIIPNGDSADHFIAEARKEAESADATDVLYSLQSSSDYDPEPKLRDIKAKVFALNFDDDEFNPEVLHVLEHLMPEVKHGKFVVQPGNSESFGHLTMAHPDLWERHVADFLKWLGDDKQSFASTSKG